MRSCPRTGAYVALRAAEGKTSPKIRRCHKQLVARELYRSLIRAIDPPAIP